MSIDRNPDPQRPSTWVAFEKGLCIGCWSGCCTLPVEATPADLVRLELITQEEAQGSLKKIAQRLLKAGFIQFYQPKTRLFVLAQRAGRDCLYLDRSRKCSVYEKRPEVCRSFPKVGPKPNFCPAFSKTDAKAHF